MRNEKIDKSIYSVGAVKKDNIKHFKDVHRKYDTIPFMYNQSVFAYKRNMK